LSTIYACGLRLPEGVQLQVADIDGARKLLHVRLGKGAKDRYVPVQPSAGVVESLLDRPPSSDVAFSGAEGCDESHQADVREWCAARFSGRAAVPQRWGATFTTASSAMRARIAITPVRIAIVPDAKTRPVSGGGS
jgi:site-specific recombinase XerC